MSNLFQTGKFSLHSGLSADFKIECDALSDTDIQTLAHIGSHMVMPFYDVIGVPRGGLRLAEAMKQYRSLEGKTILIVDDVMTTGSSMNEQRAKINNYDIVTQGLVIFSRGWVASSGWVTAIFGNYILDSLAILTRFCP